MEIRLNGQVREIPAGTKLAQVVAELGGHPAGVVVVLNGQIVRQEQREQVELQDQDQVELLSFVGGG